MTRSSTEETYLTPGEVLTNYPDLPKNLNWTASDLGRLVKCYVLEGYYDRKRRTSMIRESSLKRLISYVNETIDSQKIGLRA
jgi:hypothetical protein